MTSLGSEPHHIKLIFNDFFPYCGSPCTSYRPNHIVMERGTPVQVTFLTKTSDINRTAQFVGMQPETYMLTTLSHPVASFCNYLTRRGYPCVPEVTTLVVILVFFFFFFFGFLAREITTFNIAWNKIHQYFTTSCHVPQP